MAHQTFKTLFHRRAGRHRFGIRIPGRLLP